MAAPDAHTHSMFSWQANAECWDQSVGQDGNAYWRLLQVPALERMIPVPGKDARALDLAGGNGLVGRWLAGRGGLSLLVSTDGSEEMVKHAQKRFNGGEGLQAVFRKVDVTSDQELGDLVTEYGPKEDDPDSGFDIITINMALMDISDLNPMAKVLPKLLKKDGIFVATLLHPVFFTSGADRHVQIVEQNEHMGPHVVRSKVITKYLDVPPWRGVFEYGQPEQQYYFHRPLHELFAAFFKVGLAMDALEEPAFTKDQGVPDRVESHRNFDQLPAILAFRMRRFA
ncbi:methyltransferase type 11 [Microdochium trichocladiopsis]|uniref:Methyltransferase type 11 n=1 Tax=Microdochium trichocladiopsis TaxID=1682393 RepID=A0A9P8YJ70_9PEZI|nr:methyltransferase type 11 [Microdochium trichocladiopsis]KAH7040015.1 methyltransferase type 11 [Microdochium trichocladiopsis]